MKPVTFIPLAEEEFLEGVGYYADRSAQAARAFVVAVYRALDEIASFPEKNRVVYRNARHCRIPHFPFGIVYIDMSDRVVVIAVAHTRRDPDYWKGRI